MTKCNVRYILGIAPPLKTLTSGLKNEVYCFQCTPETPQDSIESMASHYVKVLNIQQICLHGA